MLHLLYAEIGESLEGDHTGQEKTVLGASDSDWHALSEREEADIELLMSECEYAISNAEAFAEQLSKDLSVLDGVGRFVPQCSPPPLVPVLLMSHLTRENIVML